MKLRNEFPKKVRLLFDTYKCWVCFKNGSHYGGLQLHHIIGRGSNSAFNAAPLCYGCHVKVNHNTGEERYLIAKTFEYLKRIKYVPTEKDWKFLEDHPYLIMNNDDLYKWLNLK